MNKIIFISFSHLTDKYVRDFYIDYLLSKGAVVEFWDIVTLVREEYAEAGMQTPDYLHVIMTWGELEAKLILPENDKAYYVMIVAFSGRFMKMFRLLSKYNCQMIYFDLGFMPVIGTFKPLISKIFNHLCHPWRLVKMMFNQIKVSLYKRIGLIKPFSIVFSVGDLQKGKCFYTKKIVPINMWDYEHYRNALAEKKRIVKCRYAVYLDVNLPYHNDLDIAGLKKLDDHSFYRSLNKFFDLLEKEQGLRVVIAAHPTANYSGETFLGREISRLKTAELVRDAEYVISMHSTSTGYAVLNEKPIIFIYTNEMLALYEESIMSTIKAFSSYLDSPIYNIDKIVHGSQIVIKNINKECYGRYKYSFLTSHESEHSTTPEILWREINR